MGGMRLRKKGHQALFTWEKVDYYDFRDVDEMSIFELVDMVKKLWMKCPVKLFRISLDGVNKILPLCSNSDVMNMLVEPESVVKTEPVEPKPPVKSDKSNELEDSDYNGSIKSESVTSEFDYSDFSVEDMSQFRVDVGIDFKGNVRVHPSVGKERIDSESESDVSGSLQNPNESDSDSGKKKK
ncbi:hypothetical protein V6N13_020116 [Hibiscus sabdariffa]